MSWGGLFLQIQWGKSGEDFMALAVDGGPLRGLAITEVQVRINQNCCLAEGSPGLQFVEGGQ